MRRVEQRLGVVEDDPHPGIDEVVCRRLSALGGHGQDADHDVLVPHRVGQAAVLAHLDVAHPAADLLGILVEDRRDVDAVLGEDRRARDRLAQAPGADERDVVLPLRAEDPPDLAQQAVDAVADPALAELPERREVAPNLGRVDVGVVGDLLGGDALLAHLAGLRQNLEIAAETGSDADGETIRYRPLRWSL